MPGLHYKIYTRLTAVANVTDFTHLFNYITFKPFSIYEHKSQNLGFLVNLRYKQMLLSVLDQLSLIISLSYKFFFFAIRQLVFPDPTECYVVNIEQV